MQITIKNIVLMLLMLLSAGIAVALRPTISLADKRPLIDLEAMVPTHFGDWQEQVGSSGQVVNPQQKAVIDKIYSQTLSRTYINSQGYRIMLSIAYGKNQSDALQLHKPEVCYPAQGFKLLSQRTEILNLPGRKIMATQIDTELGNRREPVTYWTVVGELVFRGGVNKKLSEIRYGLVGLIPDGMLIRVSSIDSNIANAYQIQEKFSATFVQSLPKFIANHFAGIINN